MIIKLFAFVHCGLLWKNGRSIAWFFFTDNLQEQGFLACYWSLPEVSSCRSTRTPVQSRAETRAAVGGPRARSIRFLIVVVAVPCPWHDPCHQ